MATRSSKSKKTSVRKAKTSAPTFEIVAEEPNPLADLWSSFREFLNPTLQTGREALENVYSSLAQKVLEQKEELEDRRAERKAERRQAVRKLGPRRAPSPHLQTGSLPGSAAKSDS